MISCIRSANTEVSDQMRKCPKRKQLGEKSLFPVLLLPVFSKVIHTLSPSPSLPSLSFSPSPFTACSPSSPPPLHPLLTLRFCLSSALAALQSLCYGRTRHWGLKVSPDVPADKRRWSTEPEWERGEGRGGCSTLCPGRSAHVQHTCGAIDNRGLSINAAWC